MLELGVTITAYHSKKIPYVLFIDHCFFCKYSNITYSLGCVYFNTNNCNCSLHLNTSLLEGLGFLATAPNVVHVIDPDLH